MIKYTLCLGARTYVTIPMAPEIPVHIGQMDRLNRLVIRIVHGGACLFTMT